MNDTGDIQPKPVLGERFMPEPEEVMPMIKAAERRRLELKQGLKSGTEEKPLQEAIWLAEALMNYEKGDASRAAERWRTGTLSYSVPVYVKADGGVWVLESDLFAGYESVIELIAAQAIEGKVHSIDHEVVFVADGIATIAVEWSDKDADAGIAVPHEEPLPIGCLDVDDGAVELTNLLHWHFHHEAPLSPAFYVSLSPLIQLTTNQSVQPNAFGLIGYFGTPLSMGGGALLHNSNNFEQSVCFPGAWERFVVGREILKSHLALQPPYELIRESVTYYQYFPGQQLPVLYPPGQWNHQLECRVGILVTPIGP